ncbi:MAG: hypothetical protein IJA09_01600 [Bacteroidales bacterium]|nr:hypothetical protein [Bacteroidales bacterium]
MKNIILISLSFVFMLLALSCQRGAGTQSHTSAQRDTTLVFDLDSMLMIEDFEKGYISIYDMPPFSSCSVVGSMAYAKDYNIDIFMIPESDSAYLVLSEMFNKDEEGNLLWRVTDSVKIYYPIGASIGWPGSVVKDGVIDYNLIALMPDDKDWIDTEVYDALLGVWSLDAQEKTITPLPVENISCINESYGVY